MVSTLTAIRTEVRDLIVAAGIKSQEYTAEALVPPVAVVVPGEPYLSPSSTFGAHDVNLQVLLIGGKGTNKTVTAQLDAMTETVIEALREWDLANVAQPGLLTVNGARYLGTVLYLSTTIKFN